MPAANRPIMIMMVNRDRSRPNRVRRFTALLLHRKQFYVLPLGQIAHARRGDEVADAQTVGDDQLVVANATERDVMPVDRGAREIIKENRRWPLQILASLRNQYAQRNEVAAASADERQFKQNFHGHACVQTSNVV